MSNCHNRSYTTWLVFQLCKPSVWVRLDWQLSQSGIRWQLLPDHLAGSDERPVVLPLHISWYNMSHQKHITAASSHTYQFNIKTKLRRARGCQTVDSRLKLYWQAKLRSIDSCQNGTCADHYQKTNNVGSGSLRYTMWHFPLQAGRICLTHTRSLLIRIFAILMKVNWQLSN